MLKKFAVVAAFFFAAIPLAPPAAAWDEVCVKFPLWKTAFIGYFSVVHGEPGLRDHFPVYIPRPQGQGANNRRLPDHIRRAAPDARGRDPQWDGAVHSGHFGANGSQCVDIRRLNPGDGFQVFVTTTLGYTLVHCPPHPVHAPKVGYHQQHGRYKKIWWEAWGAAGNPQCKYWRETN